MEMLNMAWSAKPPSSRARGFGLLRRARMSAMTALAILAALTLVAFLVVVRQLADAGEMRRVAVAAHWDAVWRCSTTPRKGPRESCVESINAQAKLASATTSVNVP